MEVRNLSLSYRTKAIFKGVSFSCHHGLLWIKGVSGAGKSSFLSLVMGLRKPTDGQVLFEDYAYSSHTEKQNSLFRKKEFSYCGPLCTLFYSYSLSENIAFSLPSYDVERYEKLKQVLSFSIDQKPLNQVSGGERKKAELIYSLLKKAPILILDEPFASLDEGSKRSLSTIIGLEAEKRMVLLVNHDESVSLPLNRSELVLPSGIFTPMKDGSETADEQEGTKETVNKKTHDLALKDLVREGFFKRALGGIFVFISVFLMSFGLVLRDNRSVQGNLAVSLSNDPFSYFRLNGNGPMLDYEKEAGDRQGYEIYRMGLGMDKALTIVVDFSLSGEEVHFDPSYPDGGNLQEETVSLQGEDLSKDLSYQFPDSKLCRFLADLKNKTLQSWEFNETGSICFVSPFLMDEIFQKGGPDALSFGGESPKILSSLFQDSDGVYRFEKERDIDLYLSLKVDLLGGKDFSFPQKAKGSTITFHLPALLEKSNEPKDSLLQVIADDPPTDGAVHLSAKAYRYLMFFDSAIAEVNHPYSLVLSKDETLSFAEEHANYGADSVIVCRYESVASLSYVLFYSGLSVLLVVLFASLFTAKINFESAEKRDGYFRLNGFSPAFRFLARHGFSFLSHSAAAVLALLLEKILLLPIANRIFFAVGQNHLNTVLPTNAYYDSVAYSPFPFSAFSYLSFLCLLIPVLLVIAEMVIDYLKSRSMK